MTRGSIFLLLLSAVFTPALAQPDLSRPDDVAAAAVAASASLRALDAEIEAAREQVTSAGALPNPMAMGGVQNLENDLSIDPMMTMFMIGASQTFVPRERRAAFQNIAQARVSALEAARISRAAEIERDARSAWIRIAAVDERAEVIATIMSLSEASIAAARSRYESGGGSQADVMRAQLGRSNLQHRLIALRWERRAAVARLASLLDLAPSTEVPLLSLPEEHAARFETASIDERHPALAALQAEVAAAEALIDLAESANEPEWGMEATYGFRPESSDMVSLMGRVELPIRRKDRIEPAVREAVLRRNAARERVAEMRRYLQEASEVAGATLMEAEEQLRFHHEVLMPQAQLALDSTLAAYQTSRAEFESLHAALVAYTALTTDTYELVARAEIARADLRALAAGARTIASNDLLMVPPELSSSTATAMGRM